MEYNSKAYCEEIIKNLFPSPIDGLISSKRRILQQQDHKKSRISAAEVIGNTKILHNHNDASIYATLNNMCDRFRCAIPLFCIIGGGNSYFNEEAAASRYTEFFVSDQAKDIYIRGIDKKTLPTKLSGDLTTRELTTYIPKLPMALLIANNAIGYGFSSKTLPLGIDQVCELTLYYLKHKRVLNDCDFTKVAHLFKPVFPILCSLCNSAELVRNYKQGNFNAAVETEGMYIIKNPKMVLVRTIAWGESATTVFEGFIKAMGNKDHWVAKEDLRVFTTSRDADYCDLEIILTKNKTNIFQVIELLKKTLRIRRHTHPQTNYVLNNNMINLGYPDIIRLWYEARYKSVMNSKRHTQQLLYTRLSELEVYKLVCDKKDEVIAIMKTVTSVKDSHIKFQKAFDLTLRQCEILSAANLRTLSAYKKEDITNKIIEAKAEMDALVKSFNTIDEDIIKDVESIRKKYKNDPKYSSFEYAWKGCMYLHGKGMALFADDKEMYRLIDVFKKKPKSVYLFKGANRIVFRSSSSKVLADATDVSQLSPTYFASSLDMGFRGKTSLYLKNGRWKTKFDEDSTHVCVSNRPLAITKTEIVQISIKEVLAVKRKSPHMFLFDGSIDDEFYVVSLVSGNWNDLRIQKRKLGEKLIFDPSGTNYILDVIPVSWQGGTRLVNTPFHPTINGVLLKGITTKKDRVSVISFRSQKLKY